MGRHRAAAEDDLAPATPPRAASASPERRRRVSSYFVASGGKVYHTVSDCHGLRATRKAGNPVVTIPCRKVAEGSSSRYADRTPCKLCHARPAGSIMDATMQAASRAAPPAPRDLPPLVPGMYYYAPTGQCHHTSPTCTSLLKTKSVSSSNECRGRPCSHCCRVRESLMDHVGQLDRARNAAAAAPRPAAALAPAPTPVHGLAGGYVKTKSGERYHATPTATRCCPRLLSVTKLIQVTSANIDTLRRCSKC
mmetsp:Transcript_30105/g.74695  ORF Transcript_30105/g.74695 Transcript_30105/m.74695 type:complete len:251 (-) Transcript_30105:378-1130(-)